MAPGQKHAVNTETRQKSKGLRVYIFEDAIYVSKVTRRSVHWTQSREPPFLEQLVRCLGNKVVKDKYRKPCGRAHWATRLVTSYNSQFLPSHACTHEKTKRERERTEWKLEVQTSFVPARHFRRNGHCNLCQRHHGRSVILNGHGNLRERCSYESVTWTESNRRTGPEDERNCSRLIRLSSVPEQISIGRPNGGVTLDHGVGEVRILGHELNLLKPRTKESKRNIKI